VSYKTDRLVDLFPDVYAAADTESLLYKLLDAVGLQFMDADAVIKQLLKSHWINYAAGPALDGLGSIYGVTRRELRTGELESDEAFRLRLKSVVQYFTGGGTPRAVLGAVRSALGLPFDLAALNLPDQFSALRDDIAKLITLVEFSPDTDRTRFDISIEVDAATELLLSIDNASTKEELPRIEWTFTSGAGRALSLERVDLGRGVTAAETLVVAPGSTLVLAVSAGGTLTALVDGREVGALFTNRDGTLPATLPSVPTGSSQWRFRARGGLFDISTFDEGDSFDLPQFAVEMSWTRYQPLTFEVHIPYFLDEAVNALANQRGYTGDLFVFKGLPLERIQDVVNQTKAAGVSGSVQFSLNLYEKHDQAESHTRQASYRLVEEANASENFVVGSVNRLPEVHNVRDSLTLGAIFDISPFDGNHGFA
jgi:hypothetical protein